MSSKKPKSIREILDDVKAGKIHLSDLMSNFPDVESCPITKKKKGEIIRKENGNREKD